MFFAVSLHIWGVQSPDPQEPIYSSLASRLISSVLVNPPLPLAPPLHIAPSRSERMAERITVETRILNVPMVPGPPPTAPWGTVGTLVSVGTSGTALGVVENAAGAAGVTPPATTAQPTSPELPASSVVQPVPAQEPVSMAIAPLALPSREPRVEPAAPSVERAPLSAGRIALPADRKEPDGRGPAEDQRQQREVLAVVREYTRALERLDLRATKAVYPSVDDRKLLRAFQGLEQQQFHFASCGVSFSSSGEDANARCKGNATFRPKVGSRVVRLTNHEWVFSLARDGGGWQILEARIQ